jgi:hypothetical protein
MGATFHDTDTHHTLSIDRYTVVGVDFESELDWVLFRNAYVSMITA